MDGAVTNAQRVKKIDGIDIWDVERAAETLMKAEEIKLDAKLHGAASKIISTKLMAVRAAKLQAAKKAVKGS